MRVSDYKPYYGLFFDFEYFTKIDNELITLNELFENHSDFEMEAAHIEQLDYSDLVSLQRVLKENFYTNDTLIAYLRELFDDYRANGGKPLEWLNWTFENINLNPQNYKAEYRATLESALIEWITLFENVPFDYLFHYTNRETLPPGQTETAKPAPHETPIFTNNFDNVAPASIYNHFKAGLVDKGYLTVEELNEYLKAAFELKTAPKTLFTLKHTPTKQKIYTVFYTYFTEIAAKPHNRQIEYVELLGNYFAGYDTQIIKSNWARGYRKKR